LNLQSVAQVALSTLQIPVQHCAGSTGLQESPVAMQQ
jgi:hypothetical protein